MRPLTTAFAHSAFRGRRPARDKRVAWLLLICLWALPASAQQASSNSYAGFEGRTVSKVDLAGQPAIKVDAFRGLIKQKEGAPFSMAAIKDSVQALQGTHLFSQVQVSIVPEPAGLKVLFILQPAYYVGMIFFPGATNAFPYTRLLQAVNIPEQSPYTEDLKTQGKETLAGFFQSNGYFNASVEPHLQRDETHRIVNLVFRCELRRRAKIGTLTFDGVSPQEASDLREALRSPWARLKRASLKSGQTYNQKRIAKATDFVRGHLRDQGRLAPGVHYQSSYYDRPANRANLTFQISPGPHVSVRVTGTHVSKRTIKRLVPIYEEGAVDLDLVEEGRQDFISYFQAKGYFDVKVRSRIDKQPDSVSVVYQIDRGARHRVEGVYFSGNRYFEDDDLESHILVKKGRFFSHGSYSDDLVRRSVNSLTALYKDAGFATVGVHTKVDDYEPQVDVTFEISEGAQDKVQTVRITGNRSQSLTSLLAGHPPHLAPGKPYSRHLLDLDRNQILASYFNRGYLNARFQSSVTLASGNAHEMNVIYMIDEGPQAKASDVVVLGAHHTQPAFIRSVTAENVQAGQPLSEGKFLTAENDLYNLGIFDWASVQALRPISNQTQEQVLIKVHESKLNTLDFGAGVEIIPRSGNIPINSVVVPGIPPISLGNKFTASQKSFVGPRFSFDYGRHNVLGRAETATVGTVLSRLDQRGFFTYADPRLSGSSWSSLLSVSGERTTENPVYTAELGQASLQLEKLLDRKRTKHLIARYSFERTNLYNIIIPNLVLPQDRHVRLSTVSAEYVRDSRDKPLDAHHGVYQTFDFGVTPTAFGSSSNFVRFLGQSAFYVPVKPWLTWANDIRLGLSKPFAGSFVPLSERFFSGGADSLRGFPINGAGPQRAVPVCSDPKNPATCTLISVPVGGNMLFILNSEARFPIPLKSGLGGVFFYDGGNVYNNINLKQFMNDYTNTVGAGLRYDTPVGPIRFDLGYRLNSIPGIKATQYFVTLGQAF